MQNSELHREARAIPKDQRKKIITDLPETELHLHLQQLFRAMEPEHLVEVTHGTDELGKDLVIVKQDRLGTDVYAVIAKSGDIRAKTAGKVDEITGQIKEVLTSRGERVSEEIRSQIEQARAHPVELKSVFRKLPVSKILVVIAGEISNLARKRLGAEIEALVEILDINWLVENFTAHYPQAFFEGHVIDFIQQRLQALETQHYGYKRGKILSECFVDPIVAELGKPIDLAGEHLSVFVRRKKLPFSQLKEILSRSKRVILVGDPGTGKSGALAKLTVDMLRQAHAALAKGADRNTSIPIPVLVTAAEIIKAQTADKLLDSYFGSPHVRDRLSPSTLLVDALDEVPATDRQAVVEKVEQFASGLQVPALIATRPVDVVEVVPARFEKYEILPFQIGQALKLFEKTAGNQRILSALKQGLEKVKWQIHMVPLSLLLLIELVEQHQEVPASVTELYDRYLDMVFGRWDQDKGLPVLFLYQLKKRFLGELAWQEFLTKGRLEISRAEFDAFTDEYAKKYALDRAEVGTFVGEIQRAGVLNIRDNVAFHHKSFLEYLAAFNIYERREEISNLNEQIAEIYFDDLWSEVAFFYIGQRREISDAIFDRIMDHVGDDLTTRAHKLLAGRLLQAGWHSESRTKLRGMERSLSHVRGFREQLLGEIDKAGAKISRIVGDGIVLMLAEFSLSSGFLAKEGRKLFERLQADPTRDRIDMMLALLWAQRRFWEKGELRQAVEQVLESLPKAPEFGPDEQARAMLVLTAIEKSEKLEGDAVRRRLHKLARRAPDLIRSLLPPKKELPPGLRRRARRTR